MVGRQAPKPNIRAGRGWGLDIRLEGCIGWGGVIVQGTLN